MNLDELIKNVHQAINELQGLEKDWDEGSNIPNEISIVNACRCSIELINILSNDIEVNNIYFHVSPLFMEGGICVHLYGMKSNKDIIDIKSYFGNNDVIEYHYFLNKELIKFDCKKDGFLDFIEANPGPMLAMSREAEEEIKAGTTEIWP